jgi:glycine/D-amino acid oxidase-like deaminating enzyme
MAAVARAARMAARCRPQRGAARRAPACLTSSGAARRQLSTGADERADVVICGAGLSGAAAALYLAKAGVANVTVVTAHAPLTLTSAMSTECYRDFWPTKVMVDFMGRSIELLEDRAVQTDNMFDMTQRGYAYFTAEDETLRKLQATAQTLDSDDIPYRLFGDVPGGRKLREYDPIYAGSLPTDHFTAARLQPNGIDILAGRDETLQMFPCVADDVKGVLHARRCGWFSAQQMGMDIVSSARVLGVKFVSGEVVAVGCGPAAGGSVEGVTVAPLGGGAAYDIATPAFVNAAGPALQKVHQLLPGSDGHAWGAGSEGGRVLPLHNELHAKVIFRDVNCVVPRDSPMMIWGDAQTIWDDDGEDTEWMAEAFGDQLAGKLLGQAPAGVHLRPYAHDSLLLLWEY